MMGAVTQVGHYHLADLLDDQDGIRVFHGIHCETGDGACVALLTDDATPTGRARLASLVRQGRLIEAGEEPGGAYLVLADVTHPSLLTLDPSAVTPTAAEAGLTNPRPPDLPPSAGMTAAAFAFGPTVFNMDRSEGEETSQLNAATLPPPTPFWVRIRPFVAAFVLLGAVIVGLHLWDGVGATHEDSLLPIVGAPSISSGLSGLALNAGAPSPTVPAAPTRVSPVKPLAAPAVDAAPAPTEAPTTAPPAEPTLLPEPSPTATHAIPSPTAQPPPTARPTTVAQPRVVAPVRQAAPVYAPVPLYQYQPPAPAYRPPVVAPSNPRPAPPPVVAPPTSSGGAQWSAPVQNTGGWKR